MLQHTPPRKILLHIGWPKTGTTSLQKHVLNTLEEFRYLGIVPFSSGHNNAFAQLVYLVAYCSDEKFRALEGQVLHMVQEREKLLFGQVDWSVPAIISEESLLQPLLMPTDHLNHGYSVASLGRIVDRLAQLEQCWNVSFDLLLTERNPAELLHAYYAQCLHVLWRYNELRTFKGYIEVGSSNKPGKELGFHYLRPGVVPNAFREQFGLDRVFTIAMNELFSPGMVHLSKWHPGLPDVPLPQGKMENVRSLDKSVKVGHLRMSWRKPATFELKTFLREVRNMYLIRYGKITKLEVKIKMEEEDQQRLNALLTGGND